MIDHTMDLMCTSIQVVTPFEVKLLPQCDILYCLGTLGDEDVMAMRMMVGRLDATCVMMATLGETASLG